MHNFRISTRLATLVGILSVLLIAIGCLGLFGIGQSNDALKTVYEDRTVPVGQIAHIESLLLLNRLAIATSLVTPAPDDITRNTAEVESNIAAIGKIWAVYKATTLTPDEAKLARKFEEDRAKFLQEGILPAVAALRANDTEGAKRIVLEKVRPLFGPLREEVDALQKLQLDVAKGEYDAAVVRYKTIRMVFIGSILAGLMFAALFSLTLIQGISRSLAEAVDASNAVAQGNLTYPIRVKGKDEVAEVLAALLAMQSSLAGIVGQIRTGSGTIATASSQIASGNLDLSSRTEQQASALEETASSMEQLTSTVKQNGDNARQANLLAVSASDVAIKGGQMVSRVVETMGAINESSRKIVDIIGVIDGIAFQTNILALNAAVEAARAGEQGRGFAVVASEVRNLAQRSAAAAREIKSLIGDSVEKVDAGAKLVDQAGATMDEIVASVKRVTDIMGEIASASREQEAGIGQINQAITEMDSVTQQNAALVEQAAAAAESLHDQAGNLAQVVSVFTLDAVQAVTAAPLVRQPLAAPARAPIKLVGKKSGQVKIAKGDGKRSVGTNEDWEQF